MDSNFEQLSKIKKIEDITPADYALFEKIKKVDKHPILKSAGLWGMIISVLGMMGFAYLLQVFGTKVSAGVITGELFCSAGYVCSNATHAQKMKKRTVEEKEYLKIYKKLKKSKQWNSLATLMNEYSTSKKYETDINLYKLQTEDTDLLGEQIDLEFKLKQVKAKRENLLVVRSELLAKEQENHNPEAEPAELEVNATPSDETDEQSTTEETY